MDVQVSDAATAELDDAFRWYERERPGLGHRFLDQFASTIERIVEFPRMYQVVAPNVRGARLRRFPYTVYYQVHADVLIIVSVFHARRDPIHWRSRL